MSVEDVLKLLGVKQLSLNLLSLSTKKDKMNILLVDMVIIIVTKVMLVAILILPAWCIWSIWHEA